LFEFPAGNCTFNWYTSAEGNEHVADLEGTVYYPGEGNEAPSYSRVAGSEHFGKTYYVSVDLPGQCTTGRSAVTIDHPFSLAASAFGVSCSPGSLHIETYDNGSATQYTLYQSENGTNFYPAPIENPVNTSGVFNLEGNEYNSVYFYKVELEGLGCEDSISRVDIDIEESWQSPFVTGPDKACEGSEITLEEVNISKYGKFRWYDDENNLLQEDYARTFTTTIQDMSTSFGVSHLTEHSINPDVYCETPKTMFDVEVIEEPILLSTTTRCGTGYIGLEGQEFVDDFGVGQYEFFIRNYQPSLGRWGATDPYDQFASPYLAMGNNPVSRIDPDGGFSETGAVIGAIVGGTSAYVASDGDLG